MPGPLDGIRVVEMAVIHVGPPIGYILGDLGAEVLKIERPDGGDPTRSKGTFWFDAVNRNKKSVTLDLKKESGKEALYRLVGRADVFVSNFHTALLERLGADYETLSGINSRLVYGHVGAWGPLGKDKDRRAFEALVQARSGFTAMISGGLEAEPLLIGGRPVRPEHGHGDDLRNPGGAGESGADGARADGAGVAAGERDAFPARGGELCLVVGEIPGLELAAGRRVSFTRQE